MRLMVLSLKRLVWLPFIVLLAGACGTEQPEIEPIAKAPVSGTLAGVAWQPAASAYWVSEAYYEVLLYADVPAEPCPAAYFPPRPWDYVFLRFPSSSGTFVLEEGIDGTSALNVAIWIHEGGSPAGLGRIEISTGTDLSDTRIHGGVIADFGADGQITGAFESMTNCGARPGN
jgi:hypothetical protein